MNSDEASTPTPSPGSPVTEAALARGWGPPAPGRLRRVAAPDRVRRRRRARHQRLVDRRCPGGGGVSAHAIVLTGLAGLVAGAFSMGTGEYVSVTNQNELVHAEVAVERTMHARFPEAEQAELTETFPGYGADPETAAKMAAAVSARPRHGASVPHPRGARGRPRRAALAGAGRHRVARCVLPRRTAAAAALPGRRPGPAPCHGHHRGRAGCRRNGRRPAHRPWVAALRCSASCCWAQWPWS